MEITTYQQELLERGVHALERLAQDPVIEMETKPPVCPHCDEMNPQVRVAESEAEGRLAEFVIQAECLKCHNSFLVIPAQWDCVKTTDEARQVISERTELSGFSER